METFKLLVAYFISPFSLALVAIGIAWLAKFKQREKAANRLWAVATLLLTVGALSGFTYGKRRANEYRYEPLRIEADDELVQSPSTIVVLGAGFNADEYLPPNSRVSSAYLARLLEAVRIYRQLPQSQLVISVAGKASADDKRAFVDGMIEILQLDRARVQLLSEAQSTDDEAELTRQINPSDPVLLVTSAGHMPRAMAIFQNNDLSVLAAPADYGFTRSASPNDKPWQRWVPSLDGLGSNSQFAYEAVATLASGIKKFFSSGRWRSFIKR
ncbi:MAG TPA: hypothetical protein DDZ51_03490 [Planctomycetaceae bacterium]|nr:hypothetical protein [Planctomycetaceae bacterium]